MEQVITGLAWLTIVTNLVMMLASVSGYKFNGVKNVFLAVMSVLPMSLAILMALLVLYF